VIHVSPALPLRSSLATLSFAVASLVVLYACQDNIPSQPEFARVNNRYNLTITGAGSAAAGTVTWDRGGISCAVQGGAAYAGNAAKGSSRAPS
jgi:hypothetical protein